MSGGVREKPGSSDSPIHWILWALIFGLSVLPLIKTLNELMTGIVLKTKGYVVIKNAIVPIMARLIGAILKHVFGVKTVSIGGSIFLITRGLPYELYLGWNCIGWQSLVLIAFCMATVLQGNHSTKSKLKSVVLGIEGVVAVNLLRIVATALILLRWGYGPTIVFHDQIGTILTLAWLVAYWHISNAYILEPETGSRTIVETVRESIKGVRLRSLLPDFVYGRRTMGLATMFIILTMTAMGGVAFLSVRATGDTDPSRLSFEYVDSQVVVNTISTNRILTLPEFTDLGTTHTDSYTTSSESYEHAWSFYLYGPLGQDYEMKGDLAFVLYLYASRECEVDIKFRIVAVKENGHIDHKVSKEFKEVELDTSSPSEPLELETDTKKEKFKEGQSLLVEIWFKSDSSTRTTYYFQYDSTGKHSYIDLPGIVVSENLTHLFFIALVVLPAYRALSKKRLF